MANDKTLSERIIDQAEALQKWEAVAPYTREVTDLVNEYSVVIDGVGTVFAAVAVVWNIYSKIEAAKKDAAQQKAFVEQITIAGTSQGLVSNNESLTQETVNEMILRSQAELENHINDLEITTAVTAAQVVVIGFRHDVLPFVKTFPVTGWDTNIVDAYIIEARKAIELLHVLIAKYAKIGDGGNILLLYRNLHVVVQCQFTMNQWRHGITKGVLENAEFETTRLIQVWVPVVRGLQLMSDYSFSQGVVHFEVGGAHGSPKFSSYRYYYKGKVQPGSSSNLKLVSQAFIKHRETVRDQVIPKQVFKWNEQSFKIMLQIGELKQQV